MVLGARSVWRGRDGVLDRWDLLGGFAFVELVNFAAS